MQASGASPAAAEAVSAHLPAGEDFPRVDDHLVEPEVTRDQVIDGQLVEKMPAEIDHARENSRLDYVLSGKVAPGYGTAVDLLSRLGKKVDFASDAAIVKDGTDPATGGRYLEELAFEVVSTQSESKFTEKAVKMHRRGVRRIFAIFVEEDEAENKICEWVPAKRTWKEHDRASSIDDPVLVEPLEVQALFDAVAADNAVVSALDAKGNPKIEEIRAESRAEGEAAGEAKGRADGELAATAKAILSILKARGLEPSDTVQERVRSSTELDLLQRWLQRAATASSADELLEEP